jgi:hypothetical protein
MRTLWVMPLRTMRLQVSIILLILLSCNSKQKSETKTLDFWRFKIDVPVTWHQVNGFGLDSYVGGMMLDYGDTVWFDLGLYSNPLEEEYKFKVEHGDVYLKNEKESTSDSVLYSFYGKVDTIDVEQFKVNKIYWKTIDGKRAKIVQPRQSGNGMTGVYFDRLWSAGSREGFQMNGTDLHPDNERQLLKAFETLKFKKVI